MGHLGHHPLQPRPQSHPTLLAPPRRHRRRTLGPPHLLGILLPRRRRPLRPPRLPPRLNPRRPPPPRLDRYPRMHTDDAPPVRCDVTSVRFAVACIRCRLWSGRAYARALTAPIGRAEWRHSATR